MLHGHPERKSWLNGWEALVFRVLSTSFKESVNFGFCPVKAGMGKILLSCHVRPAKHFCGPVMHNAHFCTK